MFFPQKVFFGGEGVFLPRKEKGGNEKMSFYAFPFPQMWNTTGKKKSLGK